MRLVIISVVILESILLASGEEDLFLASLKHQFADVPRDVKLFDFLQSEHNLRGLLGLHDNMCEQLAHFNELKAQNHRGKRDADTSASTPSTASVAASDATAAPSLGNNTVDVSTVSDSTTASIPVSSSAKRRRRDASDASASTTNTTASSNPADDKDQQQNLNDQQPPADDQGDQQGAPAGENQEAEMQAAGVAYFKQLVLSVIRYILNCLMTYINMFY